MKICKEGYLNNFIKPVAESGWGLCEWIVSQMAEARAYTNNEIYDLIQISELDSQIKSLSKEQVKDVCNWMIGNDFNGVIIGDAHDETITYNQSDSFGCDSNLLMTGFDNGDGTATVQLLGWKPDGAQLRWGIAYPVTADSNQYSAVHVNSPTFTGDIGTTYTLLLSCLLNEKWVTKEVTIRFSS